MENNNPAAIERALELIARSITSTIGSGAYIIKALLNSAFSAQGASFSATTTLSDVTGMSFNYTSGARAETLVLIMTVMAQSPASNATQVSLMVGGVDQTGFTYHEGAGATQIWSRQTQVFVVSVAASTTVAIKLRAKTTAGTGTVNTNTAAWLPNVTGFALASP